MATQFDLMVATTGARLTKRHHGAVPITDAEIADTARTCAAVGATAIHVHVRDEHGAHAIDPARYASAIKRIKAQANIDIQISTEAGGVFDVAAQRHCLAHVPAQDASVSLREMAREPDRLFEGYGIAAARAISVQHILYSAGEVTTLLDHFDSQTIPEQERRAIFVLGRYVTDQQSDPRDLTPFLAQLGTETLNWSVCAFGQQEHACLLAAIDQGGDARIGFENNRTAPDGIVFPDNAASVAAFVAAADKAGFQPRKAST